MRNLRWQILIALGGIILVIILLVGQSSTVETSTPQPIPGGAYTEALIGEILRLNPILDIANQVDRDIDKLIYSGLLQFDSRGIAELDLASNVAVSANATLYTFTLKEGIRWHDGEPVTADDVVYTYSKLQDEGYPGPSDLHELWKEISIVKLDQKNVQFQLPEPFAPFLDYMTVGLLPEHILRGVTVVDLIDHPFNLQPVGTGPFVFESFLIQEDGSLRGVSLTAFEGYSEETPFLERVEFHLFSSSAEAFDAYLAGEVQGIGSIDDETFAQVLNQPGLDLHSSRLPQISTIFINTQHPEKTFLAEKRVRQALLLAIDRERLINQILNGQGMIATSPILPGNWAYRETIEPTPYDPLQAASLLDELEWELPVGASPGSSEFIRIRDEQILAIQLTYPNDSPYLEIAELVANAWAAIGIQVSLNPVQGTELQEDYLQPRQYETLLTDIDLSMFPDPDPYTFWHDSQVTTGQNYSDFSDRNISIWLEQARTTPDFERRKNLYRDFQIRFMDQVPAILLYYPIYNFAIDSDLQGPSIGPVYDRSDRFSRIDEWYLLVRRSLSP
jgi:peptide/nickel transport system substrate-binding protein